MREGDSFLEQSGDIFGSDDWRIIVTVNVSPLIIVAAVIRQSIQVAREACRWRDRDR